jgi:hypothetical protein
MWNIEVGKWNEEKQCFDIITTFQVEKLEDVENISHLIAGSKFKYATAFWKVKND